MSLRSLLRAGQIRPRTSEKVGTLHTDAQPGREIRAVSGAPTVPGLVSSSLMAGGW